MSATTVFLFCLLKSVILSESGWSSPTSTLIRNDHSFAVGAYNGTIFLLGGAYYPRQITEYHINTDTFIDIGETVLTDDIWGYGQFWSQKEEIIYMVHTLGSTLSTFNMITKQYTQNAINNVGPRHQSCLAIFNDQLFVVGGYDSYSFRVLDLYTSQWMYSTPSMKEPRGAHACIAHYDYLWVFGGGDRTPAYLQTNERINIIDIASNQWEYIEPLSVEAMRSRAVVWEESILVIGGANSDESLDVVHIVDPTTGHVTVSPDRLVYPISSAGITLIQNIIYVFGGWTNVARNTWMKYTTSDLTDSPTMYTITTNTPSKYPSNTPVLNTSQPPSFEYKTSIQTTNHTYTYSTQYSSLMTDDDNNDDMTTSIIFSNESYQNTNHQTTTVDDNTNNQLSSLAISIIVAASTMSVICIVCVFGWICYRSRRIYTKRLVVENGEDVNMGNNVEGERNNELVRVWLSATVGLPQYYALFIQNGLDSLDFISKIENKQDLKDIGISIVGHQIQIMAEVKRLKNTQNNDNDDKSDDSDSDSDHSNDDLWEVQGGKEGYVQVQSTTNAVSMTIDSPGFEDRYTDDAAKM